MRNKLLRDERLAAVFGLLGEAKLVADVGCDHGYLSAALLSEGRAERVIASDVSAVSCEKAARLAGSLGLSDRMKVVKADGLDSLAGEEPPYRIAVCGMGGELIAEILERNRHAAESAELIVMQPMRGEAELREYLYRSGFGITDERVILDEGRYYQIIAARYGAESSIPDGFPKDFFRFGWVAAGKRPDELMPLLRHYRSVYASELEKAKARGRVPERLVDELEKTDALIEFAKRGSECF